MKRWTQAMLGVCLAASVVACAGDNANDANNTAAQRDGGAAVGTAGSNVDRDFIQDQLEDGQAEINLGKLASERAANPQVKAFAQTMVKDHQMAADELKQAASSANVQITPAEPDGDHQDASEELAKLSGREFDRRYMEMMVEEHEEAVNELEKQQDAENPQVRQWVTKTLPKVQQHLEQARQIQQSLQEAGNTR